MRKINLWSKFYLPSSIWFSVCLDRSTLGWLKKRGRNPWLASEMNHYVPTHVGLGSCKAPGRIILREASIVRKQFYPWKDLPSNKSILSLKAQRASKWLGTKLLWQSLFVRNTEMLWKQCCPSIQNFVSLSIHVPALCPWFVTSSFWACFLLCEIKYWLLTFLKSL